MNDGARRLRETKAIREIEALCSALCDGSATPAQRERLEAYLSASSRARRLYVEFINLHGALAWACADEKLPCVPTCDPSAQLNERRVEWPADSAPTRVQPVDTTPADPIASEFSSSKTVAKSSDSPTPDTGRQAGESTHRRLGAHSNGGRRLGPLSAAAHHPQATALSVAAAVMGAALLLMAVFSPPGRRFIQQIVPAAPENSATYVASLTATRNERWKNPNQLLPVGTRLRAGQELELSSGLIEITLHDGVRLVVEGPSKLQMQRTGRVAIRSGKLSALVPSQARGFVVDAPRAAFVDLGTEFAVKVDSLHLAEAHVFQGLVEARLIGESGPIGQAVQLRAGDAARLDSRIASVERFAADGSLFARTVNDNAQQIAQQRKAFRRWEEHSKRLRADSNLIAYYRFGRPKRDLRALPNDALASTGQLDAQLAAQTLTTNSPEWVYGRWPWKGALRFAGGPEPLVTVDDPAGLTLSEQFSIATWLLPFQTGGPVLRNRDAQTERLNYQLAVFGPGALSQAGVVQFGIEPAGSAQATSVESRFVVTDGTRWHHVVVTHDGSTVRLYHNGEEVGRQAVESAFVDAASSQLWIGGGIMGDTAAQAGFVGFSGSIDEMAIFRRALTAAEVQAMMVAGLAQE